MLIQVPMLLLVIPTIEIDSFSKFWEYIFPIQVEDTQMKIENEVKRIVCEAFHPELPILFSAKNDSAQTIEQIRRVNAKWRSFGCLGLK